MDCLLCMYMYRVQATLLATNWWLTNDYILIFFFGEELHVLFLSSAVQYLHAHSRIIFQVLYTLQFNLHLSVDSLKNRGAGKWSHAHCGLSSECPPGAEVAGRNWNRTNWSILEGCPTFRPTFLSTPSGYKISKCIRVIRLFRLCKPWHILCKFKKWCSHLKRPLFVLCAACAKSHWR